MEVAFTITIGNKYYITGMGNANLTNEARHVESIKRHKSSVLGDCVYNCIRVCGSVLRLHVRIFPYLHNGETP